MTIDHGQSIINDVDLDRHTQGMNEKGSTSKAKRIILKHEKTYTQQILVKGTMTTMTMGNAPLSSMG